MPARLYGRQVLPEPSGPVNPNEQAQQTGFSRPIVMVVTTVRRDSIALRILGAAALLVAVAALTGGCGKTEP